MEKGLKYIEVDQSKPNWYKEWLQWRVLNGIGGSETPTIFGANSFESSGELFYKKCGLIPIKTKDTIDTYRGRILEPVIRNDYWPYWDPIKPDLERWEENMSSQKKVRQAVDDSRIVINEEHPWLYANTDGGFPASHGNPEGILECKAPREWAMKMAGPKKKIYYNIQAQHYLLVTKVEYVEIAILVGGSDLEVLTFEANKEIQDAIIERTKKFWDDVLKVRALQSKAAGEEEVMQLIYELEPEPTEEESWTNFLTEEHKRILENEVEEVEAMGTEKDFKLLQTYWKEHNQMTVHKKAKDKAANELKQNMNKLQCNKMTLENVGKSINWKAKFTPPKLSDELLNI